MWYCALTVLCALCPYRHQAPVQWIRGETKRNFPDWEQYFKTDLQCCHCLDEPVVCVYGWFDLNVKVTQSTPLHVPCCHFTVCPALLSFLPLRLLSQSASSGSHQWPSQPMSLFPPNSAMCYSDGIKIIGPFVFGVHARVLLQVGLKVWFRVHQFKTDRSLPALKGGNLTV